MTRDLAAIFEVQDGPSLQIHATGDSIILLGLLGASSVGMTFPTYFWLGENHVPKDQKKARGD